MIIHTLFFYKASKRFMDFEADILGVLISYRIQKKLLHDGSRNGNFRRGLFFIKIDLLQEKQKR